MGVKQVHLFQILWWDPRHDPHAHPSSLGERLDDPTPGSDLAGHARRGGIGILSGNSPERKAMAMPWHKARNYRGAQPAWWSRCPGVDHKQIQQLSTQMNCAL